MSKMIFVNLPVTDLPRSMAFYEAVGFTNNPQFTNDQAAAMMWSDTIVVMLLRHDFWQTFTSKAIPNAHDSAQVMRSSNGRCPPAAGPSRRRRRTWASCTAAASRIPMGTSGRTFT